MHARPPQTVALAVLAGLGLVTCARGPAPPPPAAGLDAPHLLDHLGGRSYPITTTSKLAQRYFDQGLALVYAFNHDAAIRSFRAAERLDPSCAMCAWGVGLAYGPNINAPMGPEAGRSAYTATQLARGLAAGAVLPIAEVVGAVEAVGRTLVAGRERQLVQHDEGRHQLGDARDRIGLGRRRQGSRDAADGLGRFKLSGLGGRTARVRVTAPGCYATTMENVAPEGTLRIVLQRR